MATVSQARNLLAVLMLVRAAVAVSGTTWYVNGLTGSDTKSCRSATAACRTIGHAISLAASGDSVRIAAATYAEHLAIGTSLELIGAAASSTIIDGTSTGRVITIPNAASVVTLSNVSIRNGLPLPLNAFATYGGGVLNEGTLTINSSTVSGNDAFARVSAYGGGISNFGALTVNNSTVSGNSAGCGTLTCNAGGGGINNGRGTVAINNSTIAGNVVRAHIGSAFYSQGGGIDNAGVLWISNSTISGNGAASGGGIYGSAHLQNTIVAGSCHGAVSSIFSLSSDSSCNLNGPGDLNNVDPKLGTLGNYGGATQTIPLLSGSPAIDAGNPSGCTDANGHLLTTDQRGLRRPDKEDTGGCDMGAYESQSDYLAATPAHSTSRNAEALVSTLAGAKPSTSNAAQQSCGLGARCSATHRCCVGLCGTEYKCCDLPYVGQYCTLSVQCCYGSCINHRCGG